MISNVLKPLHVGISVSNMEASVEWYRKNLGFEKKQDDYAPPLKARVCFIEKDGFELELFQYDDPKPIPEERKTPNTDLQTIGTKHVAFLTDDMQALKKGFVENGVDEWGEPLMLLPPAETVPFTVEILKDPVDWQLLKLENGFKREIGEESLTKIQQKQLQQAVRVGRITFFFAKRGYRAVGMCSVAAYYSTFSCSNVGVFEDFYIEPAFRNRGTARKLAEAAQSWCRENDIASLTVCCAACDEAMYQALGFNTSLGTIFANMG